MIPCAIYAEIYEAIRAPIERVLPVSFPPERRCNAVNGRMVQGPVDSACNQVLLTGGVFLVLVCRGLMKVVEVVYKVGSVCSRLECQIARSVVLDLAEV
jgi:hypothetical protein